MERKSFNEIMNGLSQRHGAGTVFSDLLTMIICGFAMKKQEELYFKTIKPYEKKELMKFSEAFAALVIEMTDDGSGMVDVLGEYFQEHLSFGRNGQFFTPMHICDMMARINNPVTPLQRIFDPTCGSGRMLMAMAKLNRFATFYGADIDANCAKMTVVNMCLNGMFGEVAHMDSLSNKWFAGWVISPLMNGCPHIRLISEKESYIHRKAPEAHEIPAVKHPLPEVVIQATKQKQLVFEF